MAICASITCHGVPHSQCHYAQTEKQAVYSITLIFAALRIHPLKRLAIVIKIHPNTIFNEMMALCSHLWLSRPGILSHRQWKEEGICEDIWKPAQELKLCLTSLMSLWGIESGNKGCFMPDLRCLAFLLLWLHT